MRRARSERGSQPFNARCTVRVNGDHGCAVRAAPTLALEAFALNRFVALAVAVRVLVAALVALARVLAALVALARVLVALVALARALALRAVARALARALALALAQVAPFKQAENEFLRDLNCLTCTICCHARRHS